MPLPLAPLIPLALRLGLAAAVGLSVQRFMGMRRFPGRTDQRAEEALDDLGEGVAVHRPTDLDQTRQTNTAARLRRTVTFRGQRYELDAGLIARFRVRKAPE